MLNYKFAAKAEDADAGDDTGSLSRNYYLNFNDDDHE